MTFVDTSAWFALFVPSDPQHRSTVDWISANREPLLTSDYCVDELLTLLRFRGEQRRAKEAGPALVEERIARLHFVTPPQFHRAWILFQKLRKDWSFTDCTSKIVMDDAGIRTILAHDLHFRQFRGLLLLP